MKKLLYLFILTFSLYQNVAAQWHQILSPTTNDLHSIFFVTDSLGFVVSQDSLIYKTSDGGLSWSSHIVVGDGFFNSIYFLNKDTGFVAGYDMTGGLIGKTTDGGITWNMYIIGYVGLNDIRFYNDSIGYAVGTSFVNGGDCCRTTDGGSTWTLTSALGFQDPRGLSTLSATSFVACANSSIVVSFNSGITWSGVFAHTFGSVFWATYFTSPDTGYAVGQDTALEDILIKTVDGGMSWSILSSGNYPGLIDVQFISPDTGFVVGASGYVLRTDNAGNSWGQENSTVTATLISVNFPSSNVGYACGQYGKIIKRETLPTNIQHPNENAISVNIFQDPFLSNIIVQINNLQSENYNLSIYDSKGQILKDIYDSKNVIQIDCNSWARGMYIWKFNIANSILKTGKLLIEK